MIKVIKNPNVKLNIPKFLCDTDAVGSHLDEHPLTNLLNVYGFCASLGAQVVGKLV